MTNNNQLHVLDFQTQTWTLTPTVETPPAVDSHFACLYGQEMIVGFGYSENDYSSSIYSLDLEKLTWKMLFKGKDKQNPKARAHCSCCLYKDQLILYGGKNTYTLGDIWSFDLIDRTFQ